ncbi:MAG: hypothetical protein ACOX4F_05625 [Atopobiaceae bacterium]|jgi:hypothetical protein
MSLDSHNILTYCEEVTKFASYGSVNFEIDECVAEAPFDTVRAGYISRTDAQRLIDTYLAQPGKSLDAAGRIPVAISIKTLVFDDPRRDSAGLVLISAMLDVNGRLSFIPHLNHPWIPLERLSGIELDSRTLVISSLEEYRQWQRQTQDYYQTLSTWGGYVDLATSMYESIAHIDTDYLASATCTIDERTSYIKAVLTVNGSAIPSEVFAGRRRTPIPRPDALEEILARVDVPGLPEHAQHKDDVVDLMKDRRGTIGTLDEVSDSAYRTLCILGASKSWHLSAIEAPVGQLGPRIACALAAALVTDAAVRGDMAPRVVIATPDSRSEHDLLDLMPYFLAQEPASITQAWADPHIISRPLKEVAFLDRAEAALGTRPLSVPNAASLVAQKLRSIDQLRCELIDAFQEMQIASQLVEQQTSGLLSLARLRRELQHAQERLVFWTDILKRNPPRKKVLSSGVASQRGIIASKAQPGEKIAYTYTNLEDVCAAYRAEISSYEEEIGKANTEAVKLDLQIRQHSSYGEVCTELVEKLARACQLTHAQHAKLNALFGSDRLSASSLDRALDATVRQVEFWLAMHFYEAKTLNQASHFSFCEVVAYHQVPTRFFSASEGAPIELLITLSSERMQSPRALACLGLSQRAVVIGDTHGLHPKWEFDHNTDESICQLALGKDAFKLVAQEELSASAPSSLLGCVLLCAKRNFAVSHEELTCLDAAPREIMSLRADAFYGTNPEQLSNAQDEPLQPLQLWRIKSMAQSVGRSLNNRNEASAIVAWLNENRAQLERFPLTLEDPREKCVVIVTPFTSQRRLLEEVIFAQDPTLRRLCEVATMRELGLRRWPVVILSAVDSVAGIEQRYSGGIDALISLVSSAARACLAVFADETWDTSTTTTEGRALVQLCAHARIKGSELTDYEKPSGPEAQEVPDNESAGEPADELGSKPTDNRADDRASHGCEHTNAQSQEDREPDTSGESQSQSQVKDEVKDEARDEGEEKVESQPQGGAPEGVQDPTVSPDHVLLAHMLNKMRRQGDIDEDVTQDDVVRWLCEDGYLMQTRSLVGSMRWVPTERGLTCGIEILQSNHDDIECRFTSTSEPYVLASIQKRREF